MSVKCKIGPVMLDRPHDMDGYEPDDNGTEKFSVKCSSKEQAVQLQGLESNVIKNEDTGTVSGGDGWGLIPVDAAVDILDNDDILPRGYYLVKSAKPDLSKNPLKARVDLECEKISSNLSDMLEMDYSTGILDNTVLSNGYPKLNKVYQFNDVFDSFNTTEKWYPAATSGITGGAISPSSGKLVFSGAATTNGTWGALWTQSREAVASMFTLETDMEWVAKPASGHKEHGLYFWLNSKRSEAYTDWSSSVLMVLTSSSSRVYYHAYIVKHDGTLVNIIPATTTTAQLIKWKFETVEGGYFNLYVDEGNGYVKKVSKMWTDGMDWKELYATYSFNTPDSSAATMKSSFLEVYNYEEESILNIVSLPAAATLEDSYDFVRTGADGDIPCCVNPTGPKRFYTTIDHFYKGTVKGWNSNNSTSTAYHLCNKKEVLAPGKFNMDNTLLKLEFTANSVKLYHYTTDWQLYDEFVIGTIKILKALYISSERITIQANSTKWTLERGKRFFRLQHQTTPITYTLKGNYDHDGATLTSPAANADVTMDTAKYTSIYNTSDQYRLIIIKQNPTTIKSDSIPADTLTGIGIFNNSDASSYNLAPSIAKEFGTQTIQAIGLKEI